MADVDLDALADKVVDRLNGSVISSAFPAHVGAWLRNQAKYSPWYTSHWLQLGGREGIQASYEIATDGAMTLSLSDPSGQMFWRGTFRPVEDTPDAHA